MYDTSTLLEDTTIQKILSCAALCQSRIKASSAFRQLYFYIFFFGLVNNVVSEQQVTVISGLAAKKFGIANLRFWQIRAIAATVAGRDSVIIQPTGSGKSICFIVPPLYDGKTAIVISPTISLMTDQVNKLIGRGVKATFLGSAQKEQVDQPISNGEF